MELVNENDREFRDGDYGPKYLFQGPRFEWGVIVCKPGQSLGTHYHNEAEETFYFLEGTPQMIVDGESHRVRPGDAFRLEPRERHSIVNDSEQDTRLVFIKCPYVPGDKVDAE